jgi:hypothetical protein
MKVFRKRLASRQVGDVLAGHLAAVGDAAGLTRAKQKQFIFDAIRRDREGPQPSAVASAPAVRERVSVFCQSQYDPDD